MRRKKLSRAARKELLTAMKDRNAQETKQDKGKILDEFVSLTGYNSGYATRLLGSASNTVADPWAKTSTRVYGEAVKESLIVRWEASDQICSKRLREILPSLIDSLERQGHLRLNLNVRNKLLAISPASIDRAP